MLVGGGWRSLVAEWQAERHTALETAVRQQLAVLVLDGSWDYATAQLQSVGFTLVASTAPDAAGVPIRQLAAAPGSVTITMLRDLPIDEFLDDGRTLTAVSEAVGSRVVTLGGPAALRSLHLRAPGAVVPLGPMSAVVDLARLEAPP